MCPMANRNTEAAWVYHQQTKHSCQSVRTGSHTLDWSNQPVPFKVSPGAGPDSLTEPMAGL